MDNFIPLILYVCENLLQSIIFVFYCCVPVSWKLHLLTLYRSILKYYYLTRTSWSWTFNNSILFYLCGQFRIITTLRTFSTVVICFLLLLCLSGFLWNIKNMHQASSSVHFRFRRNMTTHHSTNCPPPVCAV